MAEYQKLNIKGSKSHWDMIKELALSHKEFKRIKEHCGKIGIEFLSTPSEEKSLNFLVSLGLNKIKISSGEITNFPFLKKIGRLKKKVILSTGMADFGEIENAIDILITAETRRENITVLHCNTEYPTPIEDVNLFAVLTIKETSKVNIGYSDHTLCIENPIVIAALGATIIEKHFTLDRDMEGPDHKASLAPAELKTMIKSIRNIEKALGNGIKKPSQSETKKKYIEVQHYSSKRYKKKENVSQGKI